MKASLRTKRSVVALSRSAFVLVASVGAIAIGCGEGESGGGKDTQGLSMPFPCGDGGVGYPEEPPDAGWLIDGGEPPDAGWLTDGSCPIDSGWPDAGEEISDGGCSSNGPDAWPSPSCTCDLGAMKDFAANTCQGRDWCLESGYDGGCALACLDGTSGSGKHCE